MLNKRFEQLNKSRRAKSGLAIILIDLVVVGAVVAADVLFIRSGRSV